MAESQHRSLVVAPDEPAISEDVQRQLEESKAIREDAESKHVRAEQTAGEMSKVLRRIAEAMDRNPKSWDDLFDRRESR